MFPHFGEFFSESVGDALRINVICYNFKQEELEKKKAEYAEKMRNLVAHIQKQAEERRATIEAQRGEDILRIDEKAAKYRSTQVQYTHKKFLGCIS